MYFVNYTTIMNSNKYDTILDYLDVVDIELSRAYRDNNLEFLFNLKGKSGITFLWPTKKHNREFRQSILNLVADNDDDVNLDVLKALIIYDNLPNVDVFKSRNNLPNALSRHTEIDLNRSTANTVYLRSGAILELDSNFRTNKRNLSVYICANGPVSIHGKQTTLSPRTPEAAVSQRRKQTVVQSPVNSNDDYSITTASANMRLKIANDVENSYLAACLSEEHFIRDVYIEQVVSLIMFILDNCSDVVISDLIDDRILPLLSYEIVDFYFIIEPRKSFGAYLIPNTIIHRWYATGGKQVNLSAALDLIDARLQQTNANLHKCVSSRMPLQDIIEDKMRPKIEECMDSKRHQREIAKAICEIYVNMINTNTLDKTRPIYGNSLHKIYVNSPYKKILQDELRYTLNQTFERLETTYFDRHEYDDILNLLGDAVNDNVSAANLKLLNPETLKYHCSPEMKIKNINAFINSRFFLYFPLTNDDIVKFEESYEILEDPTTENNGIWFYYDRRPDAIKAQSIGPNPSPHNYFKSDVDTAIHLLQNTSIDDAQLKNIKKVIKRPAGK